MSSGTDGGRCAQAEQVSLHALDALAPGEVAVLEAHLRACPECRRELDALRGVVDSLAHWPTDVLRPSGSLWEQVAARVAAETGGPPAAAPQRRAEPQWDEVAPGIHCKLLAADVETGRVSMLVRLAPGVHYPPHRHGDVEELHLLDGELWIGHRKLTPGDYNRAEPGTEDTLVWSETGCTCVLITSLRDEIAASG